MRRRYRRPRLKVTAYALTCATRHPSFRKSAGHSHDNYEHPHYFAPQRSRGDPSYLPGRLGLPHIDRQGIRRYGDKETSMNRKSSRNQPAMTPSIGQALSGGDGRHATLGRHLSSRPAQSSKPLSRRNRARPGRRPRQPPRQQRRNLRRRQTRHHPHRRPRHPSSVGPRP
jgi:hypothetical protein